MLLAGDPDASFREWASLVSGVLYLTAFITLAAMVWRSPQAAWQTTSERLPAISPAPEGAGSL